MEGVSGHTNKITGKKTPSINPGNVMSETSLKSSVCPEPEKPFLDEELVRTLAEKLHKSSAMGYRKRRKKCK